MRFVNTEVPTLRIGAGSLVHRVPDVVREAPCQHHRPHGLRHRAAEVLPHRELQVRQPALRGGGHPGAVQRRGPGASQAAPGLEVEQPDSAAPETNRPASTNSAEDLRGGDLWSRRQGLSTQTKVSNSKVTRYLHLSD